MPVLSIPFQIVFKSKLAVSGELQKREGGRSPEGGQEAVLKIEKEGIGMN